MANNKNKIIPGRPAPAGGLSLGPLGTALPTDETVALNAALKPAGYLHKDGASLKPNRDTTDEQAWGGDTVLITQTSFGVEVTFTLIETLGELADQVAFGSANVVATPATASAGSKLATKINSSELDHWVAVIDLVSGGKKLRWVMPDLQPTTVDEITFKDDASVAYKVTAKLLPDATGQYAYKYSDDGVKTV